ncbi:NAD-dependent epimerase/dehydratase family protein [Cyclobacterium qasimii]|uniref:UDP-glucose 4-epimerase n=2 Tax=Cyclobacterium qasimii TaxID=1350429 RepID=S7VCD5_9BACT|nr:SDR family oxidoreductase [Cyclobacterium qasimii]EPR67202.1 UDP-glucose 4-epimerase [Cyclobacterium qasimii M12-11B]GEO21550.1 NAD-dependent epimerase [Cyclobacterium qasimii]
MKILITGNMGYIGPILVNHLKTVYPDSTIIGFDIGFFAQCITSKGAFPEVNVDQQVFGDVRNFPEKLLEGVDTVINLAAISNDPMGKKFEEITLDINYRSCINLAKMARKAGVRNFVFASSCSMYGAADDFPKTEDASLNPLTAYAKSKVLSENDLQGLASDDFIVTCLRFSTACGFSSRLRLDLVLNDFVAGAITSGEISILSDGTPWRAMVHVKDMARAMEWASTRKLSNGGSFTAVNIGTNIWNHQVKTMALAVQQLIPNISVTINKDAPSDKRSYKVNFEKFEKMAPDHQPQYDLEKAIKDLESGLKNIGFSNQEFRNSNLIRLKVLNDFQEQGLLNESLNWTNKTLQ